ncbi:hypothetical protein PanWU01x14_299950 [Parasponia andersonii]|uniref:Uncharacterized protein n=1 Tax=Parasponia andersonii TaxID=3476 RepID=A0A2P5AU22_PARAD|nr:hypothetical protein PanWU01x14_299950 [Parasponia andersonii]
MSFSSDNNFHESDKEVLLLRTRQPNSKSIKKPFLGQQHHKRRHILRSQQHQGAQECVQWGDVPAEPIDHSKMFA